MRKDEIIEIVVMTSLILACWFVLDLYAKEPLARLFFNLPK